MSQPPNQPTLTAPDVVHDAQHAAGGGDAQPPRKRARKSRNDGAVDSENAISAKRKGKGRQTAGSLSGLMNMPLDVFFEVAAHLHPLDMLNLARTSKSLRTLVLAKTTRSAWIASLATVDGLPSCPANMSEPSYAALIFDRHCFLCGSAHAKWVDYAIRLRLCKACYKANIYKGSDILQEENTEMLFLFPCEIGLDYRKAEELTLPQKRTPRNKYYAKHVINNLHKILSLHGQDREATVRLLKETLDDVTTTHIAAVMILIWLREQSMLKELSNKEIMSDRKSKIVERLQDLGYTEDDLPEGKDAWDKLVDQPKPLTDRIWNNIRPKLEEQLAIEKERKTREAFQDRVNGRLDVLVQWYDDYIKEHFTDAQRSLMPNRYNTRELPSLLSLAQADDAQGVVSREDFVALTEQILVDLEAYKTRAKRELADILCDFSACTDLKGLLADDVLQRYCAYFTCLRRCNTGVDGCRYLTYEQLHGHWREAHPNSPWLLQGNRNHWYTAVDVPEMSPDSVPVIGQRVLEAVGIPLDTPRGVLDGWVREGRLFCVCEYPNMPLPADMSWAKLLFHLMHQVHSQRARSDEMKLLGGKHNPNHVLCPTHSLSAGDDCCIKFLPLGADTAAASVRATVDDACRAQIEAKLAARPQPGMYPVCRICKGLTRKTPMQVRRHLRYIFMSERPDEVVWHLRYCHGKEFEKRDILFVSI